MIGETVRAARGGSSVRTYYGDALGLLERKRISGVLQENDTSGSDLANNFPVIVSDVDMFVLGVVQYVPGIEVGLWISGVLTKEVPPSENPAGA